jgi:EmrB/QacA subfamily drug resistance transporter
MDHARWRALTVGLVAAFMTLLDVSIVNVAIPSIETSLHFGSDALQWVLSGYALAFGLVLVPSGRLGDAYGRRALFLTGLAGFTVASALAGAAQNELWLILARLLQGAAAGVVNPQVSGLVQQLFEPRERSRPFGLLGSTIGISTAVGPLLGGILIAVAGPQEGWRWIFYINVPIGIAALVLGRMWLPGRPEASPARENLDPVGVLLLGAGVVALLLPLVQERQWTGWAKWLLIPLAAALLAGFVGWERRVRGEPLVDLSLFRRRSYGLGSLIGLLYFAGFSSIFFIFTLFMQAGLHLSALAAGLAITPFAVGSALASAIGGRIVNRFGRPLVAAGLVVVAAGLAGTALVLRVASGSATPWATAGPLLIAGLGSGFVIAPNQTLTLAEVPVRRAGSAGGVLQTGQRMGTAVGIAAAGVVFFHILGSRPSSLSSAWSSAFQWALLVAIAFVVATLAIALTDVGLDRRSASRGVTEAQPTRRP